MKILIAPNAFKGSLTAKDAAHCIVAGLKRSGLHATFTQLPIADGGDGTLPVLAQAIHLDMIQVKTTDALRRPILAQYGWNEQSATAIVELAVASGIRHLDKNELNPWQANTYGTGVLIKDAISQGARKILLTIGGSASVDGGVGMLEALGVLYYNETNVLIKNLDPSKIKSIAYIDSSAAISLLDRVAIEVLCDVTNPLLGGRGSAPVFAPQKGASQADVIFLEQALALWKEIIFNETGVRVANLVHGGASGGAAAGLHGVLNAELKEGSRAVLNYMGFFDMMHSADIVITGEGQLDTQTLDGKAPGAVARAAKKEGKQVVGFCGASSLAASNAFFDEVIEVNQPNESLDQSIANTADNLEAAACLLGNRLMGNSIS